MKFIQSGTLIISALLGLVVLGGFAAVASAADSDWRRIDTITVTHHPDDRVQVVNVYFDGRFQRISFRARDNNVRCDHIRVNYVSGGHQIIDHDRFPEGERRAFDLYGDDRRIASIRFECTPGRQSDRAHLVIFGL